MSIKWLKVLEDSDSLAEGRVMTVEANNKQFCLTKYQGKYACLDNKCPHQGGPLGEGSIENGLLRCPWHGWDFDPINGKAPGFDDGVETFPIEIREDGIYIGLEIEEDEGNTVSDLMVETMINGGVNVVFGMVGHSNLGFAEALRKQEQKGNLRYFGIRHEGAASFAASAHGKLTGKPAACFAIAGPGATNLFTGLWDAKVDRAPILALTGQVATQVVGTGNFQELDLIKAFQTVADFNHRVLQTSRHGELMTLAIKHAIINRDVSHLTFPDEVQIQEANPRATPKFPLKRIASYNISPPQNEIKRAIDKINNSKKPLIIVGHGSRFNMGAIIELAEKLNCPVLTTFKGKGQISDSHPLAGGVLGRSGTPIASWFMNESDLILVFGASFSKHTGITPKKPIIQIDFDPLALAKFHSVEIMLWGEIGVTANILKTQMADSKHIDQRAEIKNRWNIWKKEKVVRLEEDRGKGISSIAVIDALNQSAPENAIMCVDVGNNAYSFGRYYESKSNNSFLMSGYLGSIGFALPAAMGAWAAQGDTRPVIAVAGDGGLMQYLGEINTLVMYQMDIKLIILNNFELGKISKEQLSSEYSVWKTKLSNPGFAEYAELCGAKGIKVEKREELQPAMEKLMRLKGPALLEVITDPKLI